MFLYSAAPLMGLIILIEADLSSALPQIYERSPRRGGGGGGSSSTSSSSGGSSLSIGSWFAKHKALIIGVGCAGLVVLGLAILFCCLRRRKNKRQYTTAPNPGNYPGNYKG